MYPIQLTKELAELCRDQGVRRASLKTADLSVEIEMAFVRNPNAEQLAETLHAKVTIKGEPVPSARVPNDWMDAFGNQVPVLNRDGKPPSDGGDL